MERKENILKKILMSLILLAWFAPLIQRSNPFVQLRPLNGAVTYSPDDSISIDKWFSGTYAPIKEKYIKEQFGFRNFFVRLKNQLFFSLLKVSTANGVVIGKDGFLFEQKYIAAYTGKDFEGENALRAKLNKIKFLTDTLKKLNIDLVLLFAPGKASYYPEYIPYAYFRNSDTVKTNYKYAARIAKEIGLNYIDYNALFRSKKEKTAFPLFPKTGIHWSRYAAVYATDTLVKYIENISHKQLPHFKYNKVEWSYTMQEPDEDIALGLNTIFNIAHFKLPYPALEYYDTLNKYKPKAITISDSFWGNIYHSDIPKHVFADPQFWYFYSQDFDYGPNVYDPLTFDLQSKIENSELIIIMSTEAHIPDMGMGFIENAYAIYSKGAGFDECKKNACIYKVKGWMRSDAKWMFELSLKAKKANISLDSMMTIEAISDIDGGWFNINADHVPDPKIVEGIKANMQIDAEWMKELNKKAAFRNIPVDRILTFEAKKIWENRKVINLQASNGKYVCADASRNDLVLANRDAASGWETFSIFFLRNDKCAISSFKDKFFCAELKSSSEITATRDYIGAWETLTIVHLDNNYVAFKASNGKYLSLDETSLQLLAGISCNLHGR